MSSPFFLQPKKVLKDLAEVHPQFLNDSFCDPYTGCEFGCLYCYGIKEEEIAAEPGSPWPYPIGIKTSCAHAFKNEIVARALSPGNASGLSIGFGFASDPYQSCEEQYQITRRCLEIALESSVPVQILTKSAGVLRDKDLLRELSEKGLAAVSISLFSLRFDLSALFEPRVPAPQKRIGLIRELRKENIACGAHLMPIFPYLTDSEEELGEVFGLLGSAGALYCVPGILSLSGPGVQARVFRVLREKFPRAADQYAALYDTLGRPALNYCERMEKILKALSEKFNLPLNLPVLREGKKTSLIVRHT